MGAIKLLSYNQEKLRIEELSKQLPEIYSRIGTPRCFRYFLISLIDDAP